MANEYQVAWLGAETLVSVPSDVQVAFVGAEILQTTQGLGQIAALSLEVMQSVQASGQVAAIAVEVLRSIEFKVSPPFLDEGDSIFAPVFYEPFRPNYADGTDSTTFAPSVYIEPGSLPEPDVPAEWNPYRPDIPISIAESDPETYDYMRQQAETIREQHDKIQAGDTTFPWELAVKRSDTADFTLGAVTRFQHADYGMIHAKYVQFSAEFDYAIRPFVGQESGAAEWIVTNVIANTNPNAVRGLSMCYNNHPAGQYGWIQIDGPGTFDLELISDTKPESFERFTWSQTDPRQVNLLAGRAVGYVVDASKVAETLDGNNQSYSPKHWTLSTANWMVDLTGYTRAYYDSIVADDVASLQAQVDALDAAIAALQANDYGDAIAALQEAQALLTQQLDFEAKIRNTTDANLSSKIQLLNDAVSGLLNAGGYASTGDLASIQNQVNINANKIAVIQSDTSDADRLTVLEAWKATAQAQIDTLNALVGATMSRWAVSAVGTGVSQAITLPVSSRTVNDVLVFVNGVRWETSEYTIAGDQLTMTSNAAGDSIEIVGL